MQTKILILTLWAGAALAQTPPPGDDKSAKTRVLEAGAKLLQNNGPPARFDIYLVGFHPMKDHPEQQMEAHHYCQQMNEDFAQCMLFSDSSSTAHLNGIEYIISEKLFGSLPAAEKPYWHPHNGEILSGQLVAPGLPASAEQALMKTKMNSYGKTWHVWHGADALPLGDPMLAWSFNRDGEARPGLVEDRDRRLKTDTAARRRERAELAPLARPQQGVDALKGRFARPTRDIPAVRQAPGTAPE